MYFENPVFEIVVRLTTSGKLRAFTKRQSIALYNKHFQNKIR